MNPLELTLTRGATPLLAVLLVVASPLRALAADDRNIVQLSASASVDVPQDLFTLSLGVTREGVDPTQVQQALKQVLEPALQDAKKKAAPGAMEVRTGNFSLQPRYGRDSRVSGWVGNAELILEGSDSERIAATAARLQGMVVTSTQFSLSREQRRALESQVQSAAIERFKARAQEVAHGFGFNVYTLRDISISAADAAPVPRVRMFAAEARAMAADAPIPVEAGKSTVQITVQGSVQLSN